MATLKGTSVSGNLSVSGLTTASSADNHKGVKIGNTYVNAINGSIIFQNNEAIRFGTDAWDWNQWAGLKYVHSSKKIVLGLADNSEFTANSAQSGGTFKLAGISTIDCNTTASISNLPIGGGLYWNPYVESSSDATDAASITVIKDGNGSGGTVLQLRQANDANDIINLVAGDARVNGYSIIHSNNIGDQSVNYASYAHLLRTYDANGSSHGSDYYLKCRHNVGGDNRFKLQIVRSNGTVTHSTAVDYAEYASKSTGMIFTGDIAYQGSNATTSIIRFLNNTNDPYGNGVSIGGGGLTVIGAGESSQANWVNTMNHGTEDLYLVADGNIIFAPNSESSVNSNKIIYDSSANLNIYNGDIILHGSTTQDPIDFHPRLIFSEGDWTQPVALTYTDWDAHRPSKGLAIKSPNDDDTNNVYLEVQGAIYARGNKPVAYVDSYSNGTLTLNAG